jgi:hypothetical protein
MAYLTDIQLKVMGFKYLGLGAMSLIRKSTKEWSMYIRNPAVKIKKCKKNLLELEKQSLKGFVK